MGVASRVISLIRRYSWPVRGAVSSYTPSLPQNPKLRHIIPEFDRHFYTMRYADRIKDADPLTHFLVEGIGTGLAPSPELLISTGQSDPWLNDTCRRSGPHVSICMPVYNRRELAGRAVASLLGQSHADVEIIVVDDGSTDGTADQLSKISDSRLHIVRQPQNIGNLKCRNMAFDLAKGDYVALMDSDDLAYPWRIRVQINALRRGFDVCLGPCVRAGGKRWNPPTHHSQLKITALFGSPGPNPSMMMTRNFLESNRFRFNEDYFPAADYHAWASLLVFDKARFVGTNAPLLYQQHHSDQISAKHASRQELKANSVRRELLRGLEVTDETAILAHNKIASRRFDDFTIDDLVAAEKLYFDIFPGTGVPHLSGPFAESLFEKRLQEARAFVPISARPRNSRRPDVSVIIPIYNTRNYLKECVDSVIQQEGVVAEIILVNDGSTDGSGEYCEHLIAGTPRAKCVNQPNGGLSAARNTGAKLASGRYVYFLDSDDTLEPGSLRKLVSFGDSNNCCIVVAGHYYFDDHSSSEKQPRLVIPKSRIYTQNIFLEFSRRTFGFTATNKLIANRLAESLEFKLGINHEDELYCPQLFMEARRVGCLADYTYNYRGRPDSITASITEKHIRDWCLIIDYMTCIFRSRQHTSSELRGFLSLFEYLRRGAVKKLSLVPNPASSIRELVDCSIASSVRCSKEAAFALHRNYLTKDYSERSSRRGFEVSLRFESK
jgi:glycosyltransferase involved in cell wall biosynthesis